MKASDIRVCILRIEGTNCESEMYQSFARLGAKPEYVHLNQLVSPAVPAQRRRHLGDYDILMIPGGFSSGDYVRAGAIWAARMKSALKKDIENFVEGGRAVGGICNGFQVLVEIGLLPGFDTTMSDVPQAVLNINDSSRFECRPTLLRHDSRGKCAFTGLVPKGSVRLIPSAHAEGKFMLPKESEKALLRRMIDNDQVVFRYVGPEGREAPYPWNPNGALDSIAGICNEQGNVFGMMPHPERVFYRYQHPDWTRDCSSAKNSKKSPAPDSEGDGRAVFESVIEYTKKKF